MLDVAGQDATEAFEDVGHSDEARETLDQLYAGVLKRQVRLDDIVNQHPRHPIGRRGRAYSPLLRVRSGHLLTSNCCPAARRPNP